jgi:hypothetical protein
LGVEGELDSFQASATINLMDSRSTLRLEIGMVFLENGEDVRRDIGVSQQM